LLESGLDAPVARPDENFTDPHPLGDSASDSKCSSPDIEAARYFGDYELLEEIARGGMGVVYRARQTSLGRIVALKMLLAGPFASKQLIQRFRGEVTAAALLQHPNIVAVHDVGIHEGQHYFSMDYVEGQNLSQLVGAGPLPTAKAARYVKLIAEAIHYAHQQGILHRDLKPSNVLVDASDQPRITDFGLAKRLDGDVSITMTGQMLGSPNFMPPEQATDQRGKLGRHSDVYGLGAILYHLLTARPPFQAESFESVINQVLNAEPVSPRLLNSSVPADLETICVKCLQKEPAARYQSAQDLADELNHFLHHEPIRARPITRAERTWRWCRRNPVVAVLGVALILAIVIGFAGVTWQLRRVSREESISRRNLYTADMNRVLQTWDQGNLQLAQELLRAHLPEAGKEDLRGFEWRYLQKLCSDESRFSFTNVEFSGGRNRLAIGAEAQTLIVATGDTLKWMGLQKRSQTWSSAIGPPAITSFSAAPGRPGLIAFHTDRVQARSPAREALLGGGLSPGLGVGPDSDSFDAGLALSWDGAQVAISGTNWMGRTFGKSTVRIFDVATGNPLGSGFTLGEKEDILSLAFSPDGKYLACGTLGTKIHILEAPSLKPVKVLTGHSAGINFLAFDRSGSKLVSGGGDSHIRVWSFPDCKLAAELTGYENALALSPDGLRLATGASDHAIRLWNLARLELPPAFLHGHRGAVTSVLFSRDGKELYTGSNDGTVKVWDAFSQVSSNVLHHADWADDVCFSPDGTLIAVTDFNARTAVLWDVTNRGCIGPVGKHSGPCRGVKFSPDGKLIATSGNDGTVQISDVLTRNKLRDLPIMAGDAIASLTFHPCKAILATAREDLRFWDLRDGTQLNLLPDAPTSGVGSVIFSPDGKWLVLGMQKGQVFVWDFVTGRQLRSFHEHSSRVNALCFSHDARFLASGGNDSLVVLYDVRKAVVKPLKGHFSRVFGLAFAPDDKTLVSTSWDGSIRFWSMANYQVALKLGHDGGGVNSVAFSPDGNFMATCGADGTARLWPAATPDHATALKKAKAN
jgi:WD40 repeat protein/serine/threonine protein kinase